jgi:hypothetical protein
MIETEEYTFDDDVFVPPHHRLRNALVINSSSGQIRVRPGDGRNSHSITIEAGDGIVLYDPESVGLLLLATTPQTSVIVTRTHSRALYQSNQRR